jgi:hypothetical protein
MDELTRERLDELERLLKAAPLSLSATKELVAAVQDALPALLRLARRGLEAEESCRSRWSRRITYFLTPNRSHTEKHDQIFKSWPMYRDTSAEADSEGDIVTAQMALDEPGERVSYREFRKQLLAD